MKFAKEGYFTMILTTIVVSVVGFFSIRFMPEPYGIMVSIPFLVIWGIVIYFFRDPERVTPDNDKLIISPADGKVVLVKETEEPVFIGGKATQVSIFLSPLNVHVNRNPVSGVLDYLKYHPGEYLMAWDHNASELNERADFGVTHSSGLRFFYRQITGFLARRIVYHVKQGDELISGERFGMMKFGSRMDILIPPQTKVKVKEGDVTRAGETIIAEIGS